MNDRAVQVFSMRFPRSHALRGNALPCRSAARNLRCAGVATQSVANIRSYAERRNEKDFEVLLLSFILYLLSFILRFSGSLCYALPLQFMTTAPAFSVRKNAVKWHSGGLQLCN
jgi:hypothetical protein